ncbi:MAG: tetratricopeptide repeat protein [Sideroxydans sp.]|nr:tetratricopeptide repeat protein [Sideroxydans sp.]
MFAVLFPRFKKIILFIAMLLGVSVTPFAHADAADACLNFLKAQDYVRAETEAKTRLELDGLMNSEEKFEVRYCLGRVYQNTGRSKDALLLFLQLEASSKTTDELAAIYGWLGVVYASLNDQERAALYDQRAIKAYRELGDKSNEVNCLSNLASVVLLQGDTERALKLYQEALGLQPNESKKTYTLNNIALIYVHKKQMDKAVKTLRLSIEIDERNNNSQRVAQDRTQLGDVLLKQGELNAAERELTAGLKTAQLIGDKRTEAKACKNLGMLWLKKRSITNASDWFGKAETLYREIGDTASANFMASILAAGN